MRILRPLAIVLAAAARHLGDAPADAHFATRVHESGRRRRAQRAAGSRVVHVRRGPAAGTDTISVNDDAGNVIATAYRRARARATISMPW